MSVRTGTEIGREPGPVDAVSVARPLAARLVGGLFCEDTDRDWDWEGICVGGKLHLYCYLPDTVVALDPFDFEG